MKYNVFLNDIFFVVFHFFVRFNPIAPVNWISINIICSLQNVQLFLFSKKIEFL